MLKDVQAIARARVSVRGPGPAANNAAWGGQERRRVHDLVAQCDAYLGRAASATSDPLAAVGIQGPHGRLHACARHVTRARDALRRAYDDLSAQWDGISPDDAAGRRALASAYAVRVNTEQRQIFDDLFGEYAALARSGDATALADLAEAAGVPSELALALAAARPLPGAPPSEAGRAAFDDLYRAFGKAIGGFIRARVGADADVDDVAQEAWQLIWEKLPAFNPVRSPFAAYARYWAGVAVMRYGDRKSSGPETELAVSQLASRFPEILEEEGTEAVLDRIAARRTELVAPEDYSDLYTELLRLTLASQSPPHQLIAFGYSKMAGWTPRRIAAELSEEGLRGLERRLEQGYLDESGLPSEVVSPCFGQLRDTLEQPFEVVVRDARTLATYPALHERIVGDTCFRDYYTGAERTADITQWWFAVQRRVKSEILRSSAGPLYDLLARIQARPARNRPDGRTEG